MYRFDSLTSFDDFLFGFVTNEPRADMTSLKSPAPLLHVFRIAIQQEATETTESQ
jgi:hypothetical protein